MFDDLFTEVSLYPPLADRLKTHPHEVEVIQKYVEEIKSDFNPTVLKYFSTTLTKIFGRLYSGIHLETPEGLDLEKLLNEYNVILVPNHQSHVDYLALSHVFYQNFQIPIYIAGGINLNIFPIGTLFRKSGAFFIRRTFGHDEIYKLAFEGYLFYLLKLGGPIEFFFEGGRSRTGKLLAPRFGLFQMLLHVYQHSSSSDIKPMIFLPVSVMHEQVAEERSYLDELGGQKKEKESSSQLMKLFSFWSKKLGSINIRVNNPIHVEKNFELKETTRTLAFECFRRVGKGMMVTPTSLLSLILLDETEGALPWGQILQKAKKILHFCENFNVPLSTKLRQDYYETALRQALDLLIHNKKIRVIMKHKIGMVYYAINADRRPDLLYSKNTILHHFLLPAFIYSTWIKISHGEIKSEHDFKRFFLKQRKQVKFEFYLPEVKEFYSQGLKIVSHCLNRPIVSIKECLALSPQDMLEVVTSLEGFSRSYSYIYEGYYVGAKTLHHLANQKFNMKKYLEVSKEIFDIEKIHGRIIKFPESYSLPIMNNSMFYFKNIHLVKEDNSENTEKTFVVTSKEEVSRVIDQYTKDLTDLVAFHIRSDED